MTPAPQAGHIVRVRQRQYFVEEVVPRSAGDDATLVRLSCLDDDAQGQPLEVLWEKEVDAEPIRAEAWQKIASKGFDPPKLFSAYLHTLQWNCVTSTDPNLFQSPFRAGIRIDAYQLEPLQKALRLPRVNLFIADDVGLGKTIEAGLIARELLLRKKVQDIVVACPPSMLLQWQDELEDRFGMVFQILDKEYIARVRRERGYGVNPWTTHSRFLVSHRLLIDEAYTATLRDWLADFRPGSLLILDEAHHAAPSSGARYAIDSKITRAIRDLAARFEHRLFLSATPHNGHSNSFSAVLEILDPQRFCRGVPVRSKKLLEAVMVRRLKEDLRAVAGGFPRRIVRQIDLSGLPANTPELRLSVLLDQYRELREERLTSETKRKQAAAALLISGLQQRLLSSVEAFARTLRVHRRTVQRQWDASGGKQRRPNAHAGAPTLFAEGIDNDDDRATLSEEELQAEEDAQIEAATLDTAPSRQDAFAREQQLLDEMTEVAEAGRGLPDARVHKLVDWIRGNMCPDLPPLGTMRTTSSPARWNNARIIIFTEYDDTKRYLQQQLSSAIATTDRASERIAIYHGPTPPAEREEIKRAFTTDPRKQPVRILIATDAAREGLNLQTHCWNLFHFDVPWNPSRLEQRNGRIDRKLQPNPEVYCHYFVYTDREEDRILEVLVKKTETIKRELGSLSQVLESRLSVTLKKGIRHRDIAALAQELEETNPDPENREVVEEELEATRERQEDLKDQIQRLQSRLKTSQDWLALREDHFRSAISCALQMMHADPLKPLAGGDDWDKPIDRFTFPALDQRQGADPTWSETMDTLRPPRTRDQKPWEWRRESPIRPVVFHDPGTMDQEVVHLHLEHRVVRRLLGRFTAQGFVHDDLSRACLSHSNDAIPRVILMGRLCLYGPRAARLHEELVPVTARWIEPSLRKGPLNPYAREAELKTLDLLETALLPTNVPDVDPVIQAKLRDAAAGDVEQLLPHLKERGSELAEGARVALAKRAEQEASAMRTILEEQKKRVAETAGKYRDPQLLLDFNDDEQRQLESNKRHWEKRLHAIDGELASEPERIRALYEIKAQRIEPVGLVYLWPVTG
ncbi:MAG: DISARM system SNF2-like helicase DrmD [Isosphaeraceae bacterium]